MRKTVLISVCVLLFSAGLFCLHITAQNSPGSPVNRLSGAFVTDVLPAASAQKEPRSLLDRKLEASSIRELLELKVAACRKLVDYVSSANEVGSPTGSFVRLAEAHAEQAAAEIELHRHTSDRVKMRIAMQARTEALTDKLKAITLAYEAERASLHEVWEAEMQLLDALLAQKQENK